MPRRKHPSVAVFDFFRTQNKEVIDLTLALIKDEVQMRFGGRQVTTPGPVKRTRKPKEPVPTQIELPFGAGDSPVKGT